jgi:type II secretory pathway component PulF
MLFEYKIIDTRTGEQRNGKIDSFSKDSAISSLQARGYTIISIKGEDDKAFWEKDFHFGSGVSDKELVILTKQLSILFTAQVSALKIFSNDV